MPLESSYSSLTASRTPYDPAYKSTIASVKLDSLPTSSSVSPSSPPSPSGYLSPDWVIPPNWPPTNALSASSTSRMSTTARRRDSLDSAASSSSSRSTASWDSDSEADTEDYELEAQLQWEESLRQLNALVNLVAVPWLSRYFGRKWAYYLFERYLNIGLGKRFWLGPLSIYAPAAWR
ncbi:hypothetical protein JCM6882_001936 [Rhodosporidiobolus microsporus]